MCLATVKMVPSYCWPVAIVGWVHSFPRVCPRCCWGRHNCFSIVAGSCFQVSVRRGMPVITTEECWVAKYGFHLLTQYQHRLGVSRPGPLQGRYGASGRFFYWSSADAACGQLADWVSCTAQTTMFSIVERSLADELHCSQLVFNGYGWVTKRGCICHYNWNVVAKSMFVLQSTSQQMWHAHSIKHEVRLLRSMLTLAAECYPILVLAA